MATMRCTYCGEFVHWEEAHTIFVPDTEFTEEKTIQVCPKCWSKYYPKEAENKSE